jgi:hypothetical protein
MSKLPLERFRALCHSFPSLSACKCAVPVLPKKRTLPATARPHPGRSPAEPGLLRRAERRKNAVSTPTVARLEGGNPTTRNWEHHE